MAKQPVRKKRSTPAPRIAQSAAPEHPTIKIDKKDFPKIAQHEELMAALARYDGLVTVGPIGLFPDDLLPDVVCAHLESHVALILGRPVLRQRKKTAAEGLPADRAEAESKLGRLLRLVNSRYPPGAKGRSKFFPEGQGEQGLDVRLSAMAAGARKPGLLVPPDLAPDSLDALAERIAAAEEEVGAATDDAQVQTTSIANLGLRTREIRDRLTDAVTGYYTLFDPILTKFGLKPRPKPKGRPRGRKAKAPGAGGTSPAK